MPDLDVMLTDLERLVNTESPSRDLQALADSAREVAELIERRLGSAATLVDSANGPHVHWSAGGAPKVLVVGHHDTVFPAGTVAARPFAVSDGRATGPGVFDMKAGIVQAVHAIAMLADRSGVELLFNSDEEVGSTASRELIEERAAACGAALVLEPSHEGSLKVARKGTGTFEVVVHGRAAHAGLEPEKGVNSLVAAAELVGHISTLGDPATGTTVTPSVIHGGTADNVVPAETRFAVDVRVVAPGEKERIERAMTTLSTSVSGAEIEVHGGIGRPPMPESASADLFALARSVGGRLGLGDITGVAVGGGSDGNFTAAVGVPTLDGLGAVGGGAHADHEWVDVAQIVPRTVLLGGLLEALQHHLR